MWLLSSLQAAASAPRDAKLAGRANGQSIGKLASRPIRGTALSGTGTAWRRRRGRRPHAVCGLDSRLSKLDPRSVVKPALLPLRKTTSFKQCATSCARGAPPLSLHIRWM